ncbi:sugar ABC transporter permease [Paenibacillus elgii]|uniref:Sugar ABC transporter permease n=1 Tax=Paenibacillus elgii TaxID=189691 RepID=A0A2T6FX28_9BACL|nr:sugar ABC transporter permease [Paenibacillus elgii]PUA36445.1 sugar ABC transporter permease [Paenibacillus elgii]
MSRWRLHTAAYALLLPFLLFYVLFMLLPLGLGLFVSLYNWSFTGDKLFVALDNYKDLLMDSDFWASLWHTFYFVIISTPTLVILGLLLALLVNLKLRGSRLFQTVYFLPNLLSIAVVTAVWSIMFQPYTGFINAGLHFLGMEDEIFWLTDPGYAWYSILTATVWWTVGFNMILFLAGLQEIPKDLYEAASLDGADRKQQLWYVTIPMLRRVTVLVTMLQVIASFKIFGQVWLMTKGGPGNATRTVVQYIYETGFRQQNMGLASAMSYVLMIVTLFIVILQFRLMNEKEKAGGIS